MNKGLSLIESLVSIFLISTLLISMLGAFYISRLSTERAKHRIAAMSFIRQYMEQEIRDGFLGGYVDGDSYSTVSSVNSIPITIDDRGTADNSSDDLNGTIEPYPYPAVITTIGTFSYKTIGFIVKWDENVYGCGGATLSCRERAVTYVSERS